MKYFFSLVVFFIFSFSFSQTRNIEKLSFDYYHSHLVYSAFNVKFKINNKREKVKLIFTKNEFRNKIKKKFNVPYEDFLKLKEAIFKINSKDFDDEFRLCIDGNSFYINFVEKENNIKKEGFYYFYCLNENDINTNLKDFLDAVNLILKFSNLKFENLE
ncbi:MAG: hypothetical protein ACI9FW_000287 [Flavobacterium sp.]|jgi:hypothetical protein